LSSSRRGEVERDQRVEHFLNVDGAAATGPRSGRRWEFYPHFRRLTTAI
jgi:hypothetical protein